MGVDPSSIIGSINNMFEKPVYDMNGSYHSRVYGWTYFSLNFVVLAPFKLIGADHKYGFKSADILYWFRFVIDVF